MKNKAKSQSIVEYAVLFAVVCVVVITTTFIADRRNTFDTRFQEMATDMAGDSFEASNLGGWN